LEYKGHSYFGQWFDKYTPTSHDAIMGPVEDFAPVGYDEAKVGEGFLKIGIGIVSKPKEPKYFFVNPYPIINPGIWKVKKKTNQVEFVQKLDDKEYSYQYKKTVQLVKGKPEMVLLHTLKNTGKRTIETEVYDHNFFVLDKQLVGIGYIVKFPYQVTGEARGSGEFGKIQDKEIIFTKDLAKNDHLQYLALRGFSTSAKDYDFSVENHNTGAAVRVTSDQPVSRFAFWSAHVTICPEPYINIKVNPGEEISWKIFYDFYAGEKNN
ncbi:MAG: hypothetical protein JWP81_1136, partial [Ferruginibacter sp.]|nr:hypothetical protein [Ferruginibacter sp.]